MTLPKTKIVAEIAQGFEGDIRLCKSFVKLAKYSGADAVKFQIFKASELCTTDYVHYNLFKSLEIDFAVWDEIIAYSNSLGIEFLCDIFGLETYEWINGTSAKGIKIHSSDTKNYAFLRAIQDYSGDVYLSCAGSTIDEIKRTLSHFKHANVTLLTGFQAEPNLYGDVELDKIAILSSEFGLPIGYADHIDANDPLAITLPAMAVLKGAQCIEKHLTMERNSLQLEDYISALNGDEFKQMVDLVRKVEQFTTNKSWVMGERESDYRVRTTKRPLAKRNLAVGQPLSDEDITFLRTGATLTETVAIDTILGRRLKRPLVQYQAILNSDLE